MQRQVRILKCMVQLPVLRKYIKQSIMTKKRGCTEARHHSSNIHIDTNVIQAGINFYCAHTAMSKFTEFINVHISGARQIPVTNAKTSDMLSVTDMDIAQHVLDTMCMKLLIVKMSFDQNTVNAKTCSMKLTNVC
jgi:hypothetical protein